MPASDGAIPPRHLVSLDDLNACLRARFRLRMQTRPSDDLVNVRDWVSAQHPNHQVVVHTLVEHLIDAA